MVSVAVAATFAVLILDLDLRTAILLAAKLKTPLQIGRHLVRAFEAGTAPFDDLTLVLLEWHGSDGLPPPLPA